MTTAVVNVEKLTRYIRELLASDPLLQDIWVEGEVSSFTIATSGHAYLTLQDGNARIDAVMWKTSVRRQSFVPRVGDNIVVHGEVTVYERQGRLQISADAFQPAGLGILQLQLEMLRQKLEAEGLFDPGRKRPLPAIPRRIGVATSATGAVWHDIQTVIARRFPLVELILAPTLVQGTEAPDQIVSALSLLQSIPDLDLIILARGGGSAEDLWAFNDERVARAIFASRFPVVSAIGHETDVTIADYVADVRAATPSAAAELVVPDIGEIAGYVTEIRRRIRALAQARVASTIREIDDLVRRLERTSPLRQLESRRSSVVSLMARLNLATLRILEHRKLELERQRALLAALDPGAILQRGYALLADASTGTPVTSIAGLQPGSRIRATVRDGRIVSSVDSLERDGLKHQASTRQIQ